MSFGFIKWCDRFQADLEITRKAIKYQICRIIFKIRKRDYSVAPIKHAVVSIFDLFSIGIGPSSSHTVGPMRAAKIFLKNLSELDLIPRISSLRVDLYGSLASTGEGHGTPNAIMMGLEGETPEGIDPADLGKRVSKIHQNVLLNLNGNHRISFDPMKNLGFHFGKSLPSHPNGMIDPS